MDEGTINTGIARSTRDRVKMAVSDDPFARQAITTFQVLERFEPARGDEGYTLVECHLYTGRTHQIDVYKRQGCEFRPLGAPPVLSCRLKGVDGDE